MWRSAHSQLHYSQPHYSQARPHLWLSATGAARRMHTAQRSYATLVEMTSAAALPDAKQVESDLPRTFPTPPLFRRSGPARAALRRAPRALPPLETLP